MKSHILIIDPDPAIREMINLALEEEKIYDVTLLERPSKYIAEIEQLQPHLIMLDIMLQGDQAGWRLLQKLKLHRPTKDIPLVVSTTLPKCEESPFVRKGLVMLYKPFNLDDLRHLVKLMLTSPSPQ